MAEQYGIWGLARCHLPGRNSNAHQKISRLDRKRRTQEYQTPIVGVTGVLYTFELTPMETPVDHALAFAYRGVRLDPSSPRARAALSGALLVKGELESSRNEAQAAKATVAMPKAKTTYSLALKKLLFQAGLKFEVRVDEAGTPFLWISTVKPL